MIEKVRNLQNGGYWKLLGIILDKAEDGDAKTELDVRENLLHIFQKVHGGAIASMIDSTIAAAAQSVVNEGEATTTIELSINYLRPVSIAVGKIFCTGKIVYNGRRILVGEATIINNFGKEVARGKSTLIRI